MARLGSIFVLGVLIAALITGGAAAQGPTTIYFLTQDDLINTPTAYYNFAPSTAQAFYSDGSWAYADVSGNCPGSASAAKAGLWIAPAATALGPITVGDIQSIVWHTNPAVVGPSAPDFYLSIYTQTNDPNPPYPPGGGWFYARLTLESLYARNRNAVANTWNTWSTAAGPNQLTFYDATVGQTVFGFYNGPTLADITGGPLNWGSYPTSGSTRVVDYRGLDVLFFVIETGSGWTCNFNGYLDGLEITAAGRSVRFDLEVSEPIAPPADTDDGNGGYLVYLPTAEDHARAQAPLCADLDGSADPIVRADVPAGTVTAGNVYCRVLARNGDYVTSPAEVGNAAVVAMRVQQAVDVFGMAGATPVSAWNNPVEVCLQGTGSFYFLDALTAPRALSQLIAWTWGDYTCASVPHAGTVVLAN